APDLVQRVTAAMLANRGDSLPVSAFPVDGTWPTGTARWEKRNLAASIPVWDERICIQCNKCAMVCPHAAIRVKVWKDGASEGGAAPPATFKSVPYKGADFKGDNYTVQVAPEDCTGCSLCVEICPAKDKANPRHKSLELAPQPLPLADLTAAQRADMPPMAIGGAIYSDVAASRFLLVNGQVVREGERAAPGVTLERIGPNAAVLRWRELRIEVPY
ncbi:MAG TPA: general secretion pathway protein GspB, partial [Rubrivivax sp.]|nr:general secretion pathway protein GspB [Rubrivivax sp.]